MIRVFTSHEFKVSEEQLAYMSHKTQEETNLSFRTVKSLSKNIQDGNVLLAVEGKQIIGWIEKYHLWGEWWGLSSLYVEPAYRDKGVGRGQLLPAAVSSLSDKYIYAATTNALVWDSLLKQHFQETTLAQYPVRVIIQLLLLRYTNLKSLIKLFQLSKKKIHYFYHKPV